MKKKYLFLLISLLLVYAGCNSCKENEIQIKAQYDADKKTDVKLALKKIKKLKLHDIFNESYVVLICRYEKFENRSYEFDEFGIFNYLVTLKPIVTLKGELDFKKIFVIVHSPGMSGFGHQKNYGKRFLLFLGKDRFGDEYFAERRDFLKAVILDKSEVTENIFDFDN